MSVSIRERRLAWIKRNLEPATQRFDYVVSRENSAKRDPAKRALWGAWYNRTHKRLVGLQRLLTRALLAERCMVTGCTRSGTVRMVPSPVKTHTSHLYAKGALPATVKVVVCRGHQDAEISAQMSVEWAISSK